MHINNLPFEVLEQIFLSFSSHEIQNKYTLRICALVCKYWNVIASPLVWKKIVIYIWDMDTLLVKNKQFSFLKHITNPNYSCGRYIQRLELDRCELYPLAIIKILWRCRNITELVLRSYYPPKGKVNTLNLLDQIPKVLPYLKVLRILFSSEYFGDEKIQEVIDNHENLQVWATRCCPNYEYWYSDSYYEQYDGEKKKWMCYSKNCKGKNCTSTLFHSIY